LTDSSQWGPPQWGQPQWGGYGPPSFGGWPPAPPAPGGVPLRPLGAGDILSGAFALIRKNPVATLGVAAVVETVAGIFTTVISRAEQHGLLSFERSVPPGATPAQVRAAVGSFLSGFVPDLAATIVLSLVFTGILTGMLTWALGRGLLGEKVSVSQAWRGARVLPVIGVSLLITAILLVVWLPVAVLVVLLVLAKFPAAAALVGVLGFLATIVLAVFLWVRFAVAVPAVVLERAGPVTALRRSWQLVQGNWWRVLGISLLALLVVGFIGFALNLPFAILEFFLSRHGSFPGLTPFSPGAAATAPSLAALLTGAVGGIIVATCTRPISSGVTVLLYADLRMRKEGLDLALQQASQVPAATANPWHP
jgi:hypothetical protein